MSADDPSSSTGRRCHHLVPGVVMTTIDDHHVPLVVSLL